MTPAAADGDTQPVEDRPMPDVEPQGSPSPVLEVQPKRVPAIRLIRTLAEFDDVEWYGDMALVEIPVECLGAFPFKNDSREEDPRMGRILQAIRSDGYNNLSPIRIRIGRRGRWVVIDGGHRLTAARRVAREFWPNIFGPKVRTLTFLVYRTPLSYTLVGEPIDPGDDDPGRRPTGTIDGASRKKPRPDAWFNAGW